MEKTDKKEVFELGEFPGTWMTACGDPAMCSQGVCASKEVDSNLSCKDWNENFVLSKFTCRTM